VLPGPWTAMRYGYFYFLISLFPYWAMMRASRSSQASQNGQVMRGSPSWKLASLGALFQFGAYGLILWAYQLTPYASYVVAFRQFSIVLGSAAAFLIYKEQGVRIRLTGALFITGGLVMIAVLGW
jgi:drug/metabolite transporter (DMT)-like permease